jgi:trans-aconitate methyltransferase
MNHEASSEKTWNTALYDGKNAFVWKHGAGVVELLDPQPGERILDLGCGTGHLTKQISDSGATVVGVDKSTSMIEEAQRLYPKLRFEISDATHLKYEQEFDAVFSNAAIHWMKDQSAVARGVWNALKRSGRFVAEFGGKGNIRAIRTALTEAVEAAGESINSEPFARYYPTLGEYAILLEAHGFRVAFARHFDRPTKLDDGEKGLRNWLFTFADNVVEPLPDNKREDIITQVEQKLRPLLFQAGSWYADYRRLRIVGIKEP